jgi:hypothetical protein
MHEGIGCFLIFPSMVPVWGLHVSDYDDPLPRQSQGRDTISQTETRFHCNSFFLSIHAPFLSLDGTWTMERDVNSSLSNMIIDFVEHRICLRFLSSILRKLSLGNLDGDWMKFTLSWWMIGTSTLNFQLRAMAISRHNSGITSRNRHIMPVQVLSKENTRWVFNTRTLRARLSKSVKNHFTLELYSTYSPSIRRQRRSRRSQSAEVEKSWRNLAQKFRKHR